LDDADEKLTILEGYLGDEEATSHAFCEDFYLTGDRAIQDEDGYFWFQSRTDDLIISSGYRIGPFEVQFSFLFKQKYS
jgi:acyl-coenzyme A synthetase/AMP-(fatty) acid ligase